MLSTDWNINDDPTLGLQQEYKDYWDSLGASESKVCSTIEEAIKEVTRVAARHGERPVTVDVFITGSLHLVGGFLKICTQDQQ